MTPYHKLIGLYLDLLKQGRALPLGGFEPAPRPKIAAEAGNVLFFAPHPDDECISGGLALRLLREARLRVINVAVTLGSKRERQQGRWDELQKACGYLGFDVASTGPNGLERVNVTTRETAPNQWAESVRVISELIELHQPRIVLVPHDRDWNSTHIGTHFLVMDALRLMRPDFECFLVETEFWGAMTDPNLMVEIGAADLADLMAATTFHVGEVGRNPYHLSLPAWMIDNVRRGGEVAGGQGGAAPDFDFAALYRLRRWSRGQAKSFFEGGRQLPSSKSVSELFPGLSAAPTRL